MTVTIHIGDCRELLRTLDDASVDSIVTDPPYELGFMGKAWDRSGVAFDAELWREVLRVAKPGAHLLAFGGSRTYHRMACAIEDAGWELRDTLMWVYGSGFPKSMNLGDGRGTALKPAWEPIIMARKPLAGTVAANAAAFGTGVLNIDGCRIGWPYGVAPEIGTPAWGGPAKKLTAVPGQDGDTVERAAPHDLGRWPANVIHDGSEEVLAAFPIVSSGKPAGIKAGGKGNAYGQFAGGIPVTGYGDSGSAARFFYCAKASKSDRDNGLSNFERVKVKTKSGGGAPNAGRQSASDGGIRANSHPTVKPTDLMRYLCRLVTPRGGLILDPFTGSGSTGRGAVLEGFRFLGCELSPEYAAIAEARIEAARQQAEAERIEREDAVRQLGMFA